MQFNLQSSWYGENDYMTQTSFSGVMMTRVESFVLLKWELNSLVASGNVPACDNKSQVCYPFQEKFIVGRS